MSLKQEVEQMCRNRGIAVDRVFETVWAISEDLHSLVDGLNLTETNEYRVKELLFIAACNAYLKGENKVLTDWIASVNKELQDLKERNDSQLDT